MKISPHGIEGTDIEITNFIKDNGFNAAQYLNLNEFQIPRYRWLLIPSIIFIVLSIITCFTNSHIEILVPLVIVSLFFGLWSIICLHLRFRNWVISSFAFLFLILIIGLSTKVYSIAQTLEHLKSTQGKIKIQE